MKKTTFLLFILLIAAFIETYAQEEKTILLDTVVVRNKAPKELRHISSDYIDKEEIKSTNTRDVGEYLRQIPNISGIRKGGSAIDPVVRGFKYSQLNVILNSGIKIENGCPNRMDPVSSHVEAEDVHNIEIIKGPFSLRYGPSFGGVINLISQDPQPYEKFEVHGDALFGMESNWNGRKVHGSIYGGNDKFYFLFSGGHRDYGNYKSGSWEGRDTTYNSAMERYNLVTKIGYSINPNHSFILSYDGVHGRDVMYPALPMDEKSDNTHIFSLDYNARNISTNITAIDVKAYRSDVHHVMDNSRRPTYQTMQMVADVDAVNTGANAAVTLKYKNHQVVSGVDFENVEKDGKRKGTMSMMGTTSTKITNLWKDALIQNTGVFTEYKTIFSSYELNASIRGDFNKASSEDTLKIVKDGKAYFDGTSSRYYNLSATLALTKIINNQLDVSLALGRGTRSPNMLERYIKLMPVGYDRYDYLGNPKLKPEINNEVDLTFRYNEQYAGSLYLNFFYSYVEDFIIGKLVPSSVVKPQSQGAPGVKQFDNADYVINKGFEVGYHSSEKYKIGGDIVAAYTYGTIPKTTKYVISEGQVVDAVELKDDALPEIPPFETTVNIRYKLLSGSLVPKLTLRVVAAQNHISEAFYETKTPAFWIMNFSTRWKISEFAEINAGVSNLFDRAYYEHLNRRIIGTSLNLYEPGRVFFAAISVNI